MSAEDDIKTKTLAVRLPADTMQAFKVAVVSEGRTVQAVVEELVKRYMAERRPNNA